MTRGTLFAVALLSCLRGLAFAQAPEAPALDVLAEGEAAGLENGGVDDEFDPLGRRRDPFRPFTLDLRTESPAEPLTPLQRYELPQLRVAAVLLDLDPPRAMLEDNSGMGFIVMPGTLIGRNQGVVKAIEARRIVVEEKVLDFYGNEQRKQVVLEMPEEKEPKGD